jgi:hypothetical protein
VVSVDWRLTAVALAVGAFVVAAVLIWNRSRRIWKRMETIETRLSKMQNEVAAILQVQAALIAKLKVNSKVEVEPRGMAVEITGGDIAGQPMSPPSPCGRFAPPSRRPCLLRCRSSVVEHSLGKGEVDSSILSGSTSGNADESGTFGDFGRERSATEKSRIVQNDPATSAISDTLVAHWNTFRSATARRPAAPSGRTRWDKIRGCFRFRGSAHRA